MIPYPVLLQSVTGLLRMSGYCVFLSLQWAGGRVALR
jgi:hypothetical protein